SNDSLRGCRDGAQTGMIQREIYLMNAASLFAKAEAEKDSATKADFENMAPRLPALGQSSRPQCTERCCPRDAASAKGSRSTISARRAAAHALGVHSTFAS